MGFFNELGKALEVKTRWLDNVTMIDGIAYQAREGILEQIQVPPGALDIREHRGIGRFHAVKPFAAHEHEAEVAEQLFIMLLAYAVKVYELPIQVVQNFNATWGFMKEDLSPPRKRFHIGRGFGKYLNNGLCQPIFPAYVRNESCHLCGFNDKEPSR